MEKTVNLGGYIITFMGSVSNNDTQTWIYKITKQDTPNPSIINWGIELCFNPGHKVIAVTGPTTARVGMGRPCLPFSANAVIWENLNNDNVNGIYTFTLEGNYQETLKQAAVYTGKFCHKAFITGPACEEKAAAQEIQQENVHPKDLQEVQSEQVSEEQEPQQKLPEENTFITRGIKIF